MTSEALGWLHRAGTTAGPFEVVILDPPYGDPALLKAAIEAGGPALTPGGRLIAKHAWRDEPPGTIGLLASERVRRFGETALTFYRRQEDR